MRFVKKRNVKNKRNVRDRSNTEDNFFLNKLELDYGGQTAEKKLLRISKRIGWLKGWPKDREAFWNGEAFMWGNKISKEKRELIRKELAFLETGRSKRKVRNLDLGCGSYSYISSVGFDISEKMLLLNDKLTERAIGDLEKKLPFKDNTFDSATLIFVLNYVKHCFSLLREVSRILKKNGKLVVVQSSSSVDAWQRKHEQHGFELERWKKGLSSVGFKVKHYQKKGLVFFNCTKDNHAICLASNS